MQAKPDLAPPDAEKGDSRGPATMEETWARNASYDSRRDRAELAAHRVRILRAYIMNSLNIMSAYYVCIVYQCVIVEFLLGE
jgi:hypothetical protein